jgi:hypothetical protein
MQQMGACCCRSCLVWFVVCAMLLSLVRKKFFGSVAIWSRNFI